MAAKYIEKLLMLLSIHSTERLVLPKPGILVSTPGASLVVWLAVSYCRATLSDQH